MHHKLTHSLYDLKMAQSRFIKTLPNSKHSKLTQQMMAYLEEDYSESGAKNSSLSMTGILSVL